MFNSVTFLDPEHFTSSIRLESKFCRCKIWRWINLKAVPTSYHRSFSLIDKLVVTMQNTIYSTYFQRIYLICQRSTFTFTQTSVRFPTHVKRLWCCSTGCAPSILNRKDIEILSHCGHGALCYWICSRSIRSIQNGVCNFQEWDWCKRRVTVASNSSVA